MADVSSEAVSAAAKAAADAVAAAEADLTAPTQPGVAILHPTVFDRLGLERRVLGFVTDEVDKDALGARNTVHALTYALSRDANTTRPPETHGRLDVEGRSVAEVAQQVIDVLDRLAGEGLVKQRKDGSYEVTGAGHAELMS